jgi:hypothetical protein
MKALHRVIKGILGLATTFLHWPTEITAMASGDHHLPQMAGHSTTCHIFAWTAGRSRLWQNSRISGWRSLAVLKTRCRNGMATCFSRIANTASSMHGELDRTGPLGSRSAVGHRSGLSRPDRGLALRATCSAPQDNFLGASGSRLPCLISVCNWMKKLIRTRKAQFRDRKRPKACQRVAVFVRSASSRALAYCWSAARSARLGEPWVGTTQAVGQRVTPLVRMKAAISASRSW